MVPEVAAQPSEGSPAPPPESMAETGAPARPGIGAGFFSSWTSICRRYQYYLDKSTPFVGRRWAGAAVLALIYFIRVDPETQALLDGSGPGLPIKSTDEFRPFVRRLPEFKFWHSIVKAFSIAFVMTFFSVFDVPVFWPILLFYWIVLFTVTMKRQIIHMIKYKYVPFTFGKQRYTGKKVPSADDLDLAN
ncbi:Retrieval of early ER protein Rer1 protein [Dioscorea alata]|uniref:Retrieval of early ER protein Rer1 protein n=1 Tax=Dioscorea alata TaxID=55571 RepID=A0ACB7WKQ0_DIOAL|nr:Retrieval of early ER protein Rer1 protein [Dioscorea alata]